MAIQQLIPIFLAVMFAVVGFLKISQPQKKLVAMMPWAKYFKPATIKFIGFCEFSAALGLAGPMILGFGHKLTPYAALGLSIIMVLAGIFHSRRKENAALLINFLLLVACLFVFFNR